jgi:hypothetical protein
MKAMIMLENPWFGPCGGNRDALDELQAPARHSTASFAVIGHSVTADRMLHRL